MNTTQLTGIVLCGGQSFRMGSDKGLVAYKDKTLVEYAINSISGYCSDIILSTNRELYRKFGYKLVADYHNHIGPLGGIFSGLSTSINDQCLITACDIPFIDKGILDLMMDKATQTKIVLLKLAKGYFQPFPAILAKNVLPVIEKQIDSGNHKLQDLYADLEQRMQNDVSIIEIEAEPLNINTKNDL